MAGFWSSSLLPFYEPIWSSGQQKCRKEINNNNKVNIQLSWLNKLGQQRIAKSGNPEGGIIGQSRSQEKSFHGEGFLSWRLVGCCFPSFIRRRIWVNKVNLSSFQLKNFFKFVLSDYHAHSKTSWHWNHVYILSCKHTSQPIRAHILSFINSRIGHLCHCPNTSEFRQRRFSATHVNRKLDGTKFVLLNVFTLIEPVYSVGSKSRLQSAQNSTSGWKRRCLNFLLCWQKRCCLWSWSVLTNGTPGSILQNY